jgi:serine phosphatase RsbU (regulator of sigma subunit)
MLTRLPDPDGLSLAARYLPAHSADQVGGDWYDGFTTGDGVTVLAIGDTVGHDIEAAADMSQLRTLLRGYAADRSEVPAETVSRLDRAMALLPLPAMASVVLARIEPPDDAGRRRLRWANAGHPPPLLVLPDGEVELLDGRPELIVGVDHTRPRTTRATDLPAGSTVLLYTDGLVERRATGRDLDRGIAGLRELLRDTSHLAPGELLDHVLAPLSSTREDDVAVLAVRTG